MRAWKDHLNGTSNTASRHRHLGKGASRVNDCKAIGGGGGWKGLTPRFSGHDAHPGARTEPVGSNLC